MADKLADLVIRFPALPGYLSISRLNTTAMAASVGFDVEDLDDLRLAVDEAVTWLLSGPSGETSNGSVELTINCRSGRLDFRGNRSQSGLPAPELDDLVHAILGATVDSYETGIDEDGCRFITLAKQKPLDG